ncbi:MAG: 2-oxoglutarate and iron-dependent oxygenase domain-containing protein [Pseudomonadota bacterium]
MTAKTDELAVIDVTAFLNGWEKASDEDRADLAAKLDHACRDIGFFYLKGHGVELEAINAMRRAVIDFFSQSLATKSELTVLKDNYRGYVPLGFFTPNDGKGVADQYEAFKLHYEISAHDPICAENGLYGPNRWPVEPVDFKNAVLAYWEALEWCGDVLMKGSALALGLDENTFSSAFSKPLTNMTLLHYPPMDEGQDGFGIHPHKDTDAFTILYPDPVGGLEIRKKDGTWIEALAPAGAFVVNIGDMIEVWSGGRFVSTPHRVVNRTGRERYSFPWFAVPRHDVMIEPLVDSLPGFERPAISSGEWSRAIWYTNYPDKEAVRDGVHVGSLRD